MKYKVNSIIISFLSLIVFCFFSVNKVKADTAYYGSIGSGTFWEYISSSKTLKFRALNGASEPAALSADKYDAKDWPWNEYRDKIEHIVFDKGTSGYGVYFGFGQFNFMFANMTNLKDVDFSGLENLPEGKRGPKALARLFSKCENLISIDISKITTDENLMNIQNMFNGCKKLQSIKIGGGNFKKTRPLEDGGVKVLGIFSNCPELINLDMSGLIINDSSTIAAQSLFQNYTKLESINLSNVKWNGTTSFANMFDGCKSLKNINMNGMYVKDAELMNQMFKNLEALETLDVSSFGKLNNILTMDDFIRGCKNLKTLIIDNLDNSNIGPKNVNHYLNDPLLNDKTFQDIGASIFGREIFGEKVYDIPSAFPNLTLVSAKKSKVWMAKNDRGLPGSEYYIAASDSDVLYLFKTKTIFTSDNKTSVVIDSKRDYIDIIIDRDGIKKHTINPPISSLPDSSTNINILYNLNTNSPGQLAPGVYEIDKNIPWVEEKIELPKTYYRIAYVGEVPFRIEGIDVVSSGNEGSDSELVMVKSENYAWLNTKDTINWPNSGEYVIDRSNKPIKLIYQNAAIDVNGKKHNVVISIKKITFKNLEKIPKWIGNERIHDSNKYIDRNPFGISSENINNTSKWTNNNDGKYYRTILQASKNDGVIFRNYVRVGNGYKIPGTNQDFQVLSGGSGTDIDFSIEIEGANSNTSFIFYGKDLDVAESQNWIRLNYDADYDYLPIENVTYGKEGESFVLDPKTNDISSVSFAKHTGLKLIDNQVITTGSDPNTTWSEFAVKSNANGANYIWKSGIACTSYSLINTEKNSLGEIEIQPILKVLFGDTLESEDFEFMLKPDNTVENNMANNIEYSKNDENGNVEFNSFKFILPKINIDGINYYPGTINDETNSNGNGTHITYTYAWIISEIKGSNENIEYDVTPRKLKIIISTPENDEEMLKGIKATIYVNDEFIKTYWSKDVSDYKYTSDIVFKNTIYREITLKKNWIDNNSSYRPDIEGYIKYELDGEETNLYTLSENWVKNDNIWTYIFKIPKNALVIDWGENEKLNQYDFKKESYIGNSDIYEMTNTLKTFDLTISKKVSGNIADRNREFSILLKIVNNKNEIINEKFNVIIDGKNQEINTGSKTNKFKLKHGEKIIIKNIPINYKYEVLEENSDYTEYYEVKDQKGNIIVKKTKGNKYSSTIDKDYIITFINHIGKEIMVPKTIDNIVYY